MERMRDPKALRALAHEVRVRLLEELVLAGQATATELAERVGESPANCSWHLRQLAKYGYVEEAGKGAGRRRPWRPVVHVRQFGDREAADAELDRAADEAGAMLLEHELAALRRWYATRSDAPKTWRNASFFLQSVAWMTPDELAAFDEHLTELAARQLDRVRDPSLRPPDARPVRMVAWGVPAEPASALSFESADRATQAPTGQPAKEQHDA